jgi:peptide/nickel transport system substrate-binding protein
MPKNWAKRAFALLLALCALLLCACAGGEAAPAENGALTLPTPTPAPVPLNGGELRMAIPTNAEETDPLKVNTKEMYSLFSLVYEKLVGIATDGTPVAELAESWSSDDEGRVWTVHLRANVYWHSGNLFTAMDVLHTFERLRDLGENSYYAICAQAIQSMLALDDTTLEVTMSQPGYASIYALSFPILEGGIAKAAPSGTGPYRVDEMSSQQVRLTANKNWWKQRPYIDTILFLERDNNDIALASYAAGQLNMVLTSNAGVGKYRQEGVTNVLDIMTQTAEMMLINDRNSSLKNASVRKALAYALDRGKIISNIYMNRAQACDVPFPPDSLAYESKSKVYDYNLARAYELLAEAGWERDEAGKLIKEGQPFAVRLLTSESSDSARSEAAQLIADQLTELGMQVELTAAAYSLSSRNSDYLDALRAGNYDLALIGINLSRNCDLTPVFAVDGAAHYGNYANPALRALAEDVMRAADQAAFRKAASALQLKFVEELPFIMLYFRLDSIVYAADIQGLADVREPNIMQTADKWYVYTNESGKAN